MKPKTFQEELEWILIDLRSKPHMDNLNPVGWEKVYINTAKAEILKLLERELPKEKETDTAKCIYADAVDGYNQCLTDLKKLLE
jgi:hypothetical protein